MQIYVWEPIVFYKLQRSRLFRLYLIKTRLPANVLVWVKDKDKDKDKHKHKDKDTGFLDCTWAKRGCWQMSKSESKTASDRSQYFIEKSSSTLAEETEHRINNKRLK